MASSLPVPFERALDRFRDVALARGYIRGIETISRLGRRLPAADPRKHGVKIIKNIPYLDDGDPAHTLDIWLPRNRQGALPCVLYIHGGAFHYLSKDTHWLMGLLFAARGYVVFNVNYRLAPEHPFPAAVEDVAKAALWVQANAARYGADPSRVAVAGESAGGGLCTALTIASCYDREESFSKELAASGFMPRACLPACGVLQASDMARFWEARPLPPWVQTQLQEIEDGYLPRQGLTGPARELADPLLLLEGGRTPARPLPPFFTVVGTRDPIMEDSTRLDAALKAMGVDVETRVYAGEIHAFHAMWHRAAARDAWAGQIAFLNRVL